MRPHDHDDVQDTIHPRVSPIPPYEGRPTESTGPRYVQAEPIPGTGGDPSRTPWSGWPAGVRPGAMPGRGGVHPDVGAVPLFAPVLLRRKSVLLAGVLGLFFGPLGLLYSSFVGAFLLAGPALLVALIAGGDAMGGIMLMCALWGMWAAHRRNERVRFLEAAYRR